MPSIFDQNYFTFTEWSCHLSVCTYTLSMNRSTNLPISTATSWEVCYLETLWSSEGSRHFFQTFVTFKVCLHMKLHHLRSSKHWNRLKVYLFYFVYYSILNQHITVCNRLHATCQRSKVCNLIHSEYFGIRIKWSSIILFFCLYYFDRTRNFISGMLLVEIAMSIRIYELFYVCTIE